MELLGAWLPICWTGCQPDWDFWAAIGTLAAARVTYLAIRASIDMHQDVQRNELEREQRERHRAEQKLKAESDAAEAERTKKAVVLAIQLKMPLTTISAFIEALTERMQSYTLGQPILHDPAVALRLPTDELEQLMQKWDVLKPALAHTIFELIGGAKLHNLILSNTCYANAEYGCWYVDENFFTDKQVARIEKMKRWATFSLDEVHALTMDNSRDTLFD